MSYYNTTALAGAPYLDAKAKASMQDDAVLQWFNLRLSGSPSEVHSHLTGSGKLDAATPLTSIRRSITNLTNAGKLVKTDEKRLGVYGRPECVWRVAVSQPTQLRLM